MTQEKQDALDLLSPPAFTIMMTCMSQGISLATFQEKMQMSEEEVDRLLTSSIPISEDAAGKLQDILGIDKQFWLNLDKSYWEKLKWIKEE